MESPQPNYTGTVSDPHHPTLHAETKSTQDPAILFSRVLREELDDIKKRRQDSAPDFKAIWPDASTWNQPAPNGAPSAESAVDPDAAAVRALRREALDNNLVGLALSGGGIRSATFCLGFLQGLAQFGLLRRLDYLSTVSGGGYIGSWLTAWIKREGEVLNVEKQLHPNRTKQAEAKRWRDPSGVLDDGPEPVQHLRAYSNYLAPRLGLFSADGWVLIAIYLRNLLLNQLVLLVFLLGISAAGFFVLKVFAAAAYVPHLDLVRDQAADLGQFYQSPDAESAALQYMGRRAYVPISGAPEWMPTYYPILAYCLVVVFIGLLSIVGYSMWRLMRNLKEGKEEKIHRLDPLGSALRSFHAWILVPLLLAAITASIYALYVLAPREITFEASTAVWFMVGFGAFHSLFNFQSYWDCVRGRGWKNLRWVASGWIAGSVGGLLFYAAVVHVHQSAGGTEAYVPTVVTLGPPLYLCVFVLTTFIQIGVQGRLLDEARREWVASLGGWIFIYASSWLAFFGILAFGPCLILPSDPKQMWTGTGQLTAAFSWLASVAGGLWAGKSNQTGSVSVSPTMMQRFLDILAKVGPILFLLGMLIGIALLGNALVYFKFPTDRQDYLERVNYAYGPTLVHDLALRINWHGLVDSWWLTWLFFLASTAILGGCALLLGHWVDVNIFSLQGLYANRLIRCYLGASRRKLVPHRSRPRGAATNSQGPLRIPNAITGFDPLDDFPLSALRYKETDSPRPDLPQPAAAVEERPYVGPIPLINTALNLVQGDELAWQERKAESFVLTPRYCGSLTTSYRPTRSCDPKQSGYAGGLSLGTAVAISGAAVSPNMGYHSSTGVTALLTVFNARLGAWLGNPRGPRWQDANPRSGLVYLLMEAFGRTNDHKDYVYLSDGGHFDNLGVYELIRRRCRFIFVCDAGCDPAFSYFDLGSLIRKVRIDFGVRVTIDVEALRPSGPRGRGPSHVVIGKIRYGDVDAPAGNVETRTEFKFMREEDEGILIYVKPILTGDEPPDIESYAADHPAFPHETTANQFFTESQFESYRALGYHAAQELLGDSKSVCQDNTAIFTALFDRWCPPPPDFTKPYMMMNQEYVAIHEALRQDSKLLWLSAEISGDTQGLPVRPSDESAVAVRSAERDMAAQMFTVLENSWFGLNLKRYHGHPVNSGWMKTSRSWMKSGLVRANWELLREEFSQEFQGFIKEILAELDRLQESTK